MTRRLVRLASKHGLLIAVVAGSLRLSAGCGSDSPANVDAGTDAGHDAGVDHLTGTGGRTGTGGSPGIGGAPVDAANPACAAAPYSRVSAFGAIFDGWMVAFNSSPEVAPTQQADGAFTGTVQELDTTMGDPTNGSIKLSIPFSGPNQTMLFAKNYTGVNLSGATVSARIKLNSGLISGPTDLGQAFLVFKSTSAYLYAAGPDIALDPSSDEWVTITANADAPSAGLLPGYTSCDIREIDVVIQTGPTGNYVPAVVHIDTISITTPGSGDGGSGDAEPNDDAGPGDSAIIPTDSATGTDAPAPDAPQDTAPTDTAGNPG